MKKIISSSFYIYVFLILFILISCDPVHMLTLENKTNNKIEVIYYPSLDISNTSNKTSDIIEMRGLKMNKIILDSAETIIIGEVVAMYTPSANDINLDYLEIRNGQDTIILNGKNAILTTIQKVKKLDWRLIVK